MREIVLTSPEVCAVAALIKTAVELFGAPRQPELATAIRSVAEKIDEATGLDVTKSFEKEGE